MASLANQFQDAAKDWINETMSNEAPSSLLARSKQSLAINLLTRFVGKNIPFATRNGFEVLEYRPGYIKVGIPLKPNKNHFNAMYAGALYTVAELPGGILCLLNFDPEYYPTLAEMRMRYLKPAKSDVTIEFTLSKDELARIQAEAKAKGKSKFQLEGELKDSDGNVVALSTAHYQVRHK